MNLGDILPLTPTKWVDNGYTISHFLGKTFFLRGGIPNIEGNFTIERITSKVIFASNYSISTDCKVFPICGGCSYRNISYEDEIHLKIEELARCLNVDQHSFDVIFSKSEHYRNNVQWKKEGSKIGFYKSFSNEIVDLKNVGCLNLDSQLIFPPLVKTQKYKEEFKFRLSNSKGIDYSKEETLIEIKDFHFKIPKNGFMQTNQYLLQPWLEKIKTLLPKETNNHIIEFYCGVGMIGIYASERIAFLEGFELVENSVRYARINAENNNLKNFKYKAIDLNKNFPDIQNKDETIWVLNPARAGLSGKVLNAILNYKPKEIVYSSCDSMTLGRDLKFLNNSNSGYFLDQIVLFDFFPRTPHYEVLVHLKKK